ncbi:MAG: hypothetical protein K6U02_05005 [Firmicutes bacterium]|nr:hypothetical protein [Bacillota bacterium]
MTVDWQAVIVGLAVATSALVLARRAWKTLRGLGGACGGCRGCPATTPRRKPLLSIESEQVGGPPPEH